MTASFPSPAPVTPPTPARTRGTYIATVKENRRLCTDHYLLVLSLHRFPRSSPGQFVELDCADPHIFPDHNPGPNIFTWPREKADAALPLSNDPDFNAPLPYLRRPFSIARHRFWVDGYVELDILHRVVGKGTLQLAQLRPGQKISVLGPLGKGFHIPDSLEHACLVGGGVGIPPMFYLADTLAQQMANGATAFVGAQRHDLLPLTFTPDMSTPNPDGTPLLNVEEFSHMNFPTVITTDDGSLGMKGYVTDALRKFLHTRQEANGHLRNLIVYCCGPTPMMKATARVAAAFNVPCQVSLEQPMACGMGTCQSCIIRYKPHDAAPDVEWKYKLTCTDGPVFNALDIQW
jgi:dihydroorotate dehydrogenase electron transfer subunit